MKKISICLVFAVAAIAVSTHAEAEAWMRLGAPDGQKYEGTAYHWLGDGPLYLDIDVAPAKGRVLDLLWGSKNDQRGAMLTVNGSRLQVKAGGYRGFEWRRVELPAQRGKSSYRISFLAGEPKAAFIAAVRVCDSDTPLDEELPRETAHRVVLTEAPPSDLDMWAGKLRREDLSIEDRALIHGLQASEALRRCRKYIDGWAAHCDPKTGLVPRNLNKSKNLWNGKDSAADNYAFMVLTSALTDRPLFEGRMTDILNTEERIATQSNGLPADYDFQKQGFARDPQPLDQLIFGGSEYVKDGLMPITEWLGDTLWSERMIRIVDSILAQSKFETPFGTLPSQNIEVNGEMMQVLSRLYFREGREAYLDMACRIADFYLLGDRHPTRDSTNLQLRDHNCELISGLTEVYAACHVVRKSKADSYRAPIHRMLDDILRVGVNEHGLMYQGVNPQTGKILRSTIHDNWGYTYNGFYTVYLLDGVEKYRDACRLAMSNLKEHYWKFQWQGWSSDGIADSVEGCINLYNREPDTPGGVVDWVDANINRMLDIQKPDGVIEGWHGDGNYARTAIMWVLMKQQGATIQPWREDVKLGAARDGDRLVLVISAEKPWKGVITFDQARHRTLLKLPLDYPRINQFPEWYTVESDSEYVADGKTVGGGELIGGVPVRLNAGERRIIRVAPTQR